MLNRVEIRGGLVALCGILLLVLVIVARPGLIPGGLLLQSLRFHILLAGLVLAALTIAFGARWRGTAVLLVVLASAVHGGMLVWTLYERRAPIEAVPVADLRFLSFNVQTGNPRAEELVEAVLADPPDVMLVMETPGVERYLDRLATVFPYSLGCADTDSCDISLHSRLPIEDGEVRRLPPFGQERLVMGRVVVGGAPVTIAGVHLSKPYFDQASWGELEFIGRTLEPVDGPMILAGDFNSASWTSAMAMMTNRLELIPGPWAPATWPVRLGPLGVPIDNVFTRGNARLTTLESGDNYGSNHRPLWADVAIYGDE
ncbi:MAG: hypothetical protein ABS75_22365 [Pelagibacterium sp. SCN 63-23]|nr:MAG: hypothetical protein ABS75_22365 [Pelagibacterium sp. SCN 63-23]